MSQNSHCTNSPSKTSQDLCRIPYPIFSRAKFCDNVFAEIESLPLKQKDQRRSQTAHIRFLCWIASLNVWATKGPNLDSMLDPSRNQVRQLIEIYLMDLQESLVNVLKAATPGNMKPTLADNHFDSEFKQIESTLTRLQRFATVLLLHTHAGFGWRVAIYRKRHEDLDWNNAIIKDIAAQFPDLQRTPHHEPPQSWKTLGVGYFNAADADSERPKAPGDQPAGLFKALTDAVLFTHYKTLYHRDESEQERKDAADPEIASWRLPIEESSKPPTGDQESCLVCPDAFSQPSFHPKDAM